LPRNRCLHLKEKFAQVVFKQSEYDPCLFVSDRVICIVYVDDTLFFSPRQEYIDEMMIKSEATRLELELEAEDNVAGFLGVLIERQEDITIIINQPGLTENFFKDLKIDHLSPKRTSTNHGDLRKDAGGDEAHGEYSYQSMVGMLGYFQGRIHNNIMFATIQCAHFIHCTKRAHEETLERIGQYLKTTNKQRL
jgi:hypothetical protein